MIRLQLLILGPLLFPIAAATSVQAGDEQSPHVVIVVGTHHYSPQETMPKFAQRLEGYGFRTTVLIPPGDPEHNKNGVGVPGLEALEDADLAIFYMRFLQLPADQLNRILNYVKSGKPVIGLRTSTHAFAYPEGHEFERWNDGFGRDVLGSKYFIHLQGSTEVDIVQSARGETVLNGVPARFIDPGTLYKAELPSDATPLLMGTGNSRKVGTVTNAFGTHELKPEMSWPVAWNWKNEWGGRVFATTLGHPQSFELPHLNRLLVNAIHWSLDLPLNASQARLSVERANRRLQRPVGLLTDHDPEIERQSFNLLPGFEVNLFAAEPMLVNPIHMTWDAQGRLWVCCSTSYPQVQPGESPNDQIIVLEDTDQDGRADKSTVFADGLYVPTGLELGDGGVYVANAPDLLFLKDTDGDLRADVREIVLTGFATEDNHHSISAWRWGPGGWLYFQEGTFMHSQVETPHGLVRLENGGIFQFRPRDLRLRVYADYRASNPWGHMFDRWGQGVLIDNPRLYFEAPLTANSRAKLSYDPSGSGTKQCGGEFTSGRHLPEEYRGQIWTNQYKAHIVARYKPSDDGAGFAINALEPIIQSDSPNFRPVDMKMGPDGAVYILDWYNPLIGHMQHSFRDERRDTTHGRVWRITYSGRPLVPQPQLVGVPLDELVKHLEDPEDWTRHQVKRVLYDADPTEAAAALTNWVEHLDENDSEFEHHRLEALWCFQTIDVVNQDLLRRVLTSRDFRARAAALRVLRYWHADVDDALDLLAQGVADEHPRVRLEAVLTLSFVPNADSVKLAVRVLDQPLDRFLEHALMLTVDGLQSEWLPAYRAGTLQFDTDDHRVYALSHLISDESVQVMIDLLNAGSVDAKRLAGPASAIARQATAKQLEPLVLTMFEHTREYKTRGREATDPAAITIVLQALNQAARQRNAVPKNGDRMLARCFDVPDAATLVAATKLAGAWGLQQESRRLQQFAADRDLDLSIRVAAAESLGELKGQNNRKFLQGLLQADASALDRYLGVIGLARGNVANAADAAAESFLADPGDANPAIVVSAFVGRRNGAEALANSLKGKQLHPRVVEEVGQYLIEIGEQHPGLVEIFGGAVTAGSLEDLLLKEDPHALAAEAREKGEPARGELIFRRESLACMKCHSIAKAGNSLGPDLAAIGSSSPPDYIIDSLLKPSKVIKEFYESVLVVTLDGQLINGILSFKDDEKVVVRDAARNGQEVTIPMDQVDLLEKAPSLMPTGLANKLNNRQEYLDLVSFIMELGRPGDYATSVTPVIRRWRVVGRDDLPAMDTAAEIAALADRVVISGKPAYSLVNGELPLDELEAGKRFLLAVGQVDVTQSGMVTLVLNSTGGITAFADGRAFNRSGAELRAGRVNLLLVVDRQQLEGKSLRVEIRATGDSAADFQLVSGP